MVVVKNMRIDQTLNRRIAETILDQEKIKRADHKSSGKLTAGMLGWPVQWQILKVIGVPVKEYDEYTLRKFLRGNHVEDWLVGHMIGVIDKQKEVTYREAIGLIDALIDSDNYEFKLGIIPHEIKSIANAKYKYIQKQGPDLSHALQACFYALAEGKQHFAVDYVAADDYRVISFILDVADYKDRVDEAINLFDEAFKKFQSDGSIPLFEAKEKWQANEQYNNYPDFMELNETQIQKLIIDKKFKGGEE